MRWSLVGPLLLSLLAVVVWAQAPSTVPLPFQPGTILKADIVTGFTSSTSQVGDQVSITTTEEMKQDKVKLPKGTTFTGRVVSVTPADPNNDRLQGSVGVLFDQVVTPRGDRYATYAGIASVKVPSAASNSNPGFGGGGGGYGRRRGMGGPPPSSSSSPTQEISVRFPEDAAKTGSVVTNARGDVWVNPNMHVTLQIIAPPAPAGR